ncbi:MAG: choice-of-anchor D domain-containing protein [Acidobacteriaceae bacterium]
MKVYTEILRSMKRARHGFQSYLLFFLLLSFSSLALAQDVTFAPASVSWGPVSVGQTSAAKTVTLTNNQSSALTISGIAFPAGSDFMQTASNCPVAPATLAAGGNCTISLAFRPLATGARTGTMSVLDDAPSSPQILKLTGTGGTGQVIFSPSSLSFSSTDSGSTSPVQTATLTNTQSSAVTIASIAATGLFKQTNDCPSSLAAQASCTISVTFAPTSTGSKTGYVNASVGSTLLQLYLSGTATAAGSGSVTFSPKSLSFPSTTVGSTSAAQTATLTNGQTGPLTISSLAVAGDFAQTASTCPVSPATLAAGATCTISLNFQPQAEGTRSGTLTVSDDASGSPQVLSLTGTGASSTGSVALSPASLTFPSTTVGSTSAAQTATLTNTQSTAVTVTNIAATGQFAQTNNCPGSLPANGSCTISVTFAPTSTGTQTGSLSLNAGSSPLQVNLSGTATSASGSVTLTPASLSFPATNVGSTSAAQTATLSNTQSTAVSVANIAATGQFAQTNNCPGSLPANGSCAISVTFAPTSSGAQTGSMNASLSSGPLQVSLSGTGNTPTGGVTYTPKQYTFPDQAPGVTSAPVNVTLTNGQSTALAISSIQLAAPFSQTNNCGSSLASGTSCTIVMTYSPTVKGYSTATLTINDNAANSPQTVAVAGNAVTPVTIKPASGGLSFYHQVMNTPSTPLQVTVTNNQSVALAINSITSTADFPFTTACVGSNGTGSLAPQATCTINVVSEPQALSTRTATLSIAVSAPGSPFTVPLAGYGIAGTPGIAVTVTPTTPCAAPSSSTQFSAIVSGTSNTAVKWYADYILGGNATAGTISESGVYTAPSTAGTHVIKAASQASPSINGTTNVSVTTTPVFAIYPFSSSLPPGGQQTFQAQVCYVPDTNGVTWTVDNIAGGNSTVGTVSSAGVYTAPATAGTHSVRVTDASLGKSSGSLVTVFSGVTIDFGSRTNTAHPIPANLLGTGRGESFHTTADRALVTQAGVTVSRLYSAIPQVYATTTPDWTKIDPMIASIQAAGMHPMIQMSYSPPWLQPTSGTCAGSSIATPTDVNKWGQIAASYVAHFDAAFPGFVQDYEIWNEPNASGLCSSNHLNDYIKIYAAAAPLMKQQAATDGATIRVGGPVLSSFASSWISTLLSTASTAPYVDFISYHQYTFGQTALNVQWDSYNGNNSVYQFMQDPSFGVSSVYNKVYALVKAGKQPLGAKTPIYVTEFNSNWAFFQDCCKNDPVYAPLFNAVYISDLLNNVYSSGAPSMPGKLVYFASNAYPYFCLIGVPDANNDCLYSAGSTPQPYPQFYTYDLLSSNDYLGLVNGGYMAASISPPTGGGGPVATAFYTASQDAIMVTNPTSVDYGQVPVTLKNVGFGTPQATLYQIVNGASINSSSLALTAQGSNYSATISLPPYSVQAISLKGQ